MKLKKLDLVNGNIPKTLLLFFIPCFFTFFFRYLYNALDIFILSNHVQEQELSVVLSGYTPINICLALIIGLCTGGTFLIGQYQGAGDINSRRRVTNTYIFLMLMFSLFLMILLVALSPLIVQWLNITPEYQYLGIKFLHISALTIPLYGICYSLSGVSRGLGKSVFPMIYLFLVSGLNMLFDYLFIAVGNFGSCGTAWSLVTANFVTSIIMVCYVLVKFGTKIFGSIKITKLDVSRIIRYSLPSAISEFMLLTCFAILVAVCNYRGFSTELVISDRFTELTFAIVYGMSNALTAAIAQNVGAYKSDRATKYLRWGIIYCLIFSIISLPAYCCLEQIAGLYTSNKEMCHEIFLRNWFLYAQLILCCFAYPLLAVQTGSGHPLKGMLMFILPTLIVQIPIFLILGLNGASFTLMAIGYPSCEVVIVIIAYIFYRKGDWKNLKTLPITEDIRREFENNKNLL